MVTPLLSDAFCRAEVQLFFSFRISQFVLQNLMKCDLKFV